MPGSLQQAAPACQPELLFWPELFPYDVHLSVRASVALMGAALGTGWIAPYVCVIALVGWTCAMYIAHAIEGYIWRT